MYTQGGIKINGLIWIATYFFKDGKIDSLGYTATIQSHLYASQDPERAQNEYQEEITFLSEIYGQPKEHEDFSFKWNVTSESGDTYTISAWMGEQQDSHIIYVTFELL